MSFDHPHSSHIEAIKAHRAKFDSSLKEARDAVMAGWKPEPFVMPTVAEVRAYREKFGTGLYESKKDLVRQAMIKALESPHADVRGILTHILKHHIR